jgi:four helix bundle protein
MFIVGAKGGEGFASMKSHKDLDVWRKSMELAKLVYEVTAGFPNEERYGLASQMRRAAVSIPSNIAEGAARYSGKEFGRFIGISQGSYAELETQCILARELGYLADARVEESMGHVGRLLTGFARSVRTPDAS